MRRHVFLAVLLSLVVSLSKEDNTGTATATPEPTAPITAEDNTGTATATPEPTAPITAEDNTGTATATPEPTTPITAEDNTGTATATPEPTAPITAEDNTGTATATPEPTTPITAGGLCNSNPCGTDLAKCIALYSNFTCQCQYGFYYRENNCHPGQIFPWVITLNESYSGSFPNVNSKEYEEMFQNITMFFNEAFSNYNLTGFEQTVIVKIESPKKVRSSLSTNITVINLFMEDASVSNETVSLAIKNATEKSAFVSYSRGASYCEGFNCDTRTTECKEKMFPTCECKSNFSRTEWDVLSCSDCSKDCSGEENKYCAKEEGVPTCKCMPNFEKKNEKCVFCPVGYSGENCSNNRELILIIVGTVFGAIILSLVVALSIVSLRAKHKQDREKRSLIKQGYSNPNASDDRQTTTFPRVQTTSGHANPGYQPNNPYEKHSANRGHFL
ncbi:mucin-13 [Rissa tridactyla]|uniref:mucin-13 n=1 Tax=Rissa tridactyla TaxID=75485 RepID=UPI0023BB054B|nr:mucin-13 [Rissa tridactyla]